MPLRTLAKRVVGDLEVKLGENSKARQALFNALTRRDPSAEKLRSIEELQFLAWVFMKRGQSHSQVLQDLWVTYETAEQRDGFFVEFGATNGITNSNTWLLERALGWKGILAEPNPVWQADLHDSRRCAIDTRCVSSRTGETVEFSMALEPELSGISRFGTRDHFASVRDAAERITVETISLDDLLDEYDAPPVIDYLSVDTEGSEVEILSRFDFTRRKVRLISVEHNHTAAEGELEALLSPHGYRRKFREFSQWDAWFVLDDA